MPKKVAPPAPKAKQERRGQPGFEATDDLRHTVKTMAACGLTQKQMSEALQISEPTLRKHFRHEIDTGLISATTEMADALFRRGKAGDTPAAIFWLKARGGWREPPKQLEHSGPAGGPIEQAVTLTDTELARKIAFTLAKGTPK